MDFRSEYERIKSTVDDALASVVPKDAPVALRDGMEYALLGGGKRLRPVLYLAVLASCGARPSADDMKAACALECVHAYSLVHDDLPAMDNDDYRRGRPTVHRKFGEATAVLAGDALLTLAFGLIAEASCRDAKFARISALLADNAGACGMVGGQAMEFEGKVADADRLRRITSLKTGKLIEAAVVGGAISAGADTGPWKEYAGVFGAAFQLCDDLLDSDSGETSLVGALGREAAKRELDSLVGEAAALLKKTGGDTAFLEELTKAFLLRNTDGI